MALTLCMFFQVYPGHYSMFWIDLPAQSISSVTVVVEQCTCSFGKILVLQCQKQMKMTLKHCNTTDFFPTIDLSNSTAKLTLNDVTISFCTDLWLINNFYTTKWNKFWLFSFVGIIHKLRNFFASPFPQISPYVSSEVVHKSYQNCLFLTDPSPLQDLT